MKKTSKKPVTAESIACQADRGEDVSRYFMNKGQMMPAIQRVNVDFTKPMLNELDAAAEELNISRQAAIKTLVRQALVRQALDWHYLATKGKGRAA